MVTLKVGSGLVELRPMAESLSISDARLPSSGDSAKFGMLFSFTGGALFNEVVTLVFSCIKNTFGQKRIVH